MQRFAKSLCNQQSARSRMKTQCELMKSQTSQDAIEAVVVNGHHHPQSRVASLVVVVVVAVVVVVLLHVHAGQVVVESRHKDPCCSRGKSALTSKTSVQKYVRCRGLQSPPAISNLQSCQ